MFASRGPWFPKRATGMGVFWIQWGIERKSERERERELEAPMPNQCH